MVYFLHLGIEIRPNFNVLPTDHWHYVVCPIELMSWSVEVFNSLGFCISPVSLSSPWTDPLVIASAVIPPTSLASSLTCRSRYLFQSHNYSVSSICCRTSPQVHCCSFRLCCSAMWSEQVDDSVWVQVSCFNTTWLIFFDLQCCCANQ